jgi:hypothetical protein
MRHNARKNSLPLPSHKALLLSFTFIQTHGPPHLLEASARRRLLPTMVPLIGIPTPARWVIQRRRVVPDA